MMRLMNTRLEEYMKYEEDNNPETNTETEPEFKFPQIENPDEELKNILADYITDLTVSWKLTETISLLYTLTPPNKREETLYRFLEKLHVNTNHLKRTIPPKIRNDPQLKQKLIEYIWMAIIPDIITTGKTTKTLTTNWIDDKIRTETETYIIYMLKKTQQKETNTITN